MSGFGSFKWGSVAYPLATSTGNSLLQDVDPVTFEALAFFAGVLNLHLGARWAADIAAVGLTGATGGPLPLVAMRTSYDPVSIFQESQFALPLLAVYRMSGKIPQRTPERNFDVSAIGLDWILPPLGPSERERLIHYQRAVVQVIADRAEQGCDPAYQSNRQVWAAAGATRICAYSYNIDSLRGKGPGVQSPVTDFPWLHIDIEFSESRAISP